MTTYVNTPASEIFSRFKGPKITSLSLTFTHSMMKEKEVATRPPSLSANAAGQVAPRGQVATRGPPLTHKSFDAQKMPA